MTLISLESLGLGEMNNSSLSPLTDSNPFMKVGRLLVVQRVLSVSLPTKGRRDFIIHG